MSAFIATDPAAATLTSTRSTTASSSAASISQRSRRKDSKWEILTDLAPGTVYGIKPKKVEGFLTKRRKWPLKGWHKRYFVLDFGVLTYAKSNTDLKKGRTLGRIDVGLAVLSAKTELFRIDIDDEDYIHHIKADNAETFGLWLEQLQQHRFYQQNLLNSSGTAPSSLNTDEATSAAAVLFGKATLGRSTAADNAGAVSSPLNGRSLAQEFGTLDEKLMEQLLGIQQDSVGLLLLLQKLEDEQSIFLHPSTSGPKPRHFFGLRKKKSSGAATSSGSKSSTLTSNCNTDMASGVAELDLGMNGLGSSASTLAGLSSSNPSIASSISGHGMGQRPPSMPVTASDSIGTTNYKPSSVSRTQSGTMSSTGSALSPSEAMAFGAALFRDELINAVMDLKNDVTNLLRAYSTDRDHFKSTLQEAQDFLTFLLAHSGRGSMTTSATFGKVSTLSGSAPNAMVASLKHALHQAMHQNAILKAKLQKIQIDADVSEIPPIAGISGGGGGTALLGFDTLGRGMNQSLSYSSSCISVSEFFDAREYTTDREEGFDETSEEEGDLDEEINDRLGDTSDEEHELFEDTESASGPGLPQLQPPAISEATKSYSTGCDSSSFGPSSWHTGRRQKLPTVRPDTSGLNLWNLLCRNIGKDLSKISMPVTLNEPLSVLQRLCEELEYSDLLDKAASCSEPVDRMIWVAAFAVSAYGSCNARAAHKPFNPLLGETYECIRDDRGFRFVSEQVSHHPPISACHADAKNWTWWQEFRVKTKFWGKSMEFQPEGMVHLELKLPDGSSEFYKWNKVTTCIHNLFNHAERWADLYGECHITCTQSTANSQLTAGLQCKLEFMKSSSGYWTNTKRHEVCGSIIHPSSPSTVLQNIFGKCTEAIYVGQAPSARCIWRPGALPDDHPLYYGFSRFAIELNEILDKERPFLPITDTRFRPDQRFLEEGFITDAENMKLKLEQHQRERQVRMHDTGTQHLPLWFQQVSKSESNSDLDASQWVFCHTYWASRSQPGFAALSLPILW